MGFETLKINLEPAKEVVNMYCTVLNNTLVLFLFIFRPTFKIFHNEVSEDFLTIVFKMMSGNFRWLQYSLFMFVPIVSQLVFLLNTLMTC